MVAGNRLPLIATGVMVAGAALTLEFDSPVPRRRIRQYDAHVRDWEHYQHLRQQTERAKPFIDAAEAKRARKNARRAHVVGRLS